MSSEPEGAREALRDEHPPKAVLYGTRCCGRANVTAAVRTTGVTVTLDDLARSPAFFLRVEVTAGEGGREVLPIRWDDNYVTLMPGERRAITARYRAADLEGARPWLRIEGINAIVATAPVAEAP